ncbi:unnamed protein product [Ixodes hexagonus]
MKTYADEKRHAVPHGFQPGDAVLLKRPAPLSHESAYEPQPYRATRVQGTAITAERGNKRIIRNASFFKRIPRRDQKTQDAEDWDASDTLMELPQNSPQNSVEDPPEIDPAEVGPSGDTTTDDTQATPQAESRRYPERQSRKNRPERLGDYVLY